jgi:hypothetical protein
VLDIEHEGDIDAFSRTLLINMNKVNIRDCTCANVVPTIPGICNNELREPRRVSWVSAKEMQVGREENDNACWS